MQERVFFQLTGIQNLKREPIKIMDQEQSCPDMLQPDCITDTHTKPPALCFLTSGKFRISDPQRLQDMTSLFLLLCLSLLLRLPWYTVDFTLHSAMITQFTSYFSPLGIITLATCPFRDKKQTRLVYFHHTYTQHTVFDFMPYPLRISKQHRNPHVMVKERISRPKRSPDS